VQAPQSSVSFDENCDWQLMHLIDHHVVEHRLDCCRKSKVKAWLALSEETPEPQAVIREVSTTFSLLYLDIWAFSIMGC
jgi:hypothetical protein